MRIRRFLMGSLLMAAAVLPCWGPSASAEALSTTEQRMLEAEQAVENGKSDVAVRIYSELLAKDPDNAEILASRGSIYCEAGLLDEAERDLGRALATAADALHPNYYMGLVKLQKGDFRGAKSFLEKALFLAKDGEERSAAEDALGQVAFREQDYGAAERHFTASIEGKESYAAYFHRAAARMKKDDDSGAEADFSRLIELYPERMEPYHQRGICRGRMGNYNAALEDLAKAIEMEPGNASIYNDRGYTYACKKEFAAAVEDYTKAVTLDPKFQLAYANRIAAYEKLGKTDLAKNDRYLLEQLMEFDGE
ncbi:MAG: tetratricopeptide repeat protein [Selenomonadaceae bacterium]|nr:tetratricopeptide repeat protein [Selenomonadaceae bacterium]